MLDSNNLLSIKEASLWATKHLGKNVSSSNISYLIQYGRIKKISSGKQTLISKQDLAAYYASSNHNQQDKLQQKLGCDLNWHLSFNNCKESKTTKHVHRLHPYKGKFIPQLVNYFLGDHTDEFKTQTYFKAGDIVLDPFAGSGTTLVQASELGMHGVGIDVSSFNAMLTNCKIAHYNLIALKTKLDQISAKLQNFVVQSGILEFEAKLGAELGKFNQTYFPVPDYKYQVRNKQIDEQEYGPAKEQEFLAIYQKLSQEFKIKLKQQQQTTFLDKWYLPSIRDEIAFIFKHIEQIQDQNIKQIVSLILSRTMRSCRATTHADLATLLEPVTKTYYCAKHGKICKPLFTMQKWWQTYAKDTLKRLDEFAHLKTNALQICLTGDSRNLDIFAALQAHKPQLAQLAQTQKIKGIFSSPPYVGLIDYHEQHAYAYDLFGFKRHDELEIGPLFKGKGKLAKQSYVIGISDVLRNCRKFLAQDFDIFLVANDKNNLYPQIATLAEMQIVQQFKRPVLNRSERDKNAYSEVIFHLKGS